MVCCVQNSGSQRLIPETNSNAHIAQANDNIRPTVHSFNYGGYAVTFSVKDTGKGKGPKVQYSIRSNTYGGWRFDSSVWLDVGLAEKDRNVELELAAMLYHWNASGECKTSKRKAADASEKVKAQKKDSASLSPQPMQMVQLQPLLPAQPPLQTTTPPQVPQVAQPLQMLNSPLMSPQPSLKFCIVKGPACGRMPLCASFCPSCGGAQD